ncbi:MAG: hypothetical protein GVY33_12380 [Alphaproteobacteria bacterium]|jgi:hypothetical protein|nr:hypothetical protein [Alphaproteobacteria bacterium]
MRMPSRLLARLLAMGFAGAAAAAELPDCEVVRPVDAAGRAVVGVEDMALDGARARLILAAYDRRAVARARRGGEPAPEGGLYALPLRRLAAGTVGVRRLAVQDLPAGGLRPHGIALAGDRLALVNRTVEGGRIVPVVDLLELTAGGPAHRARLAEPRLCRPNDLAWAGDGRLLVTNDRGACDGPALWWERLANRPASFVMALEDDGGTVAATGFRFANGIAAMPAGVVVAATRGRRLHHLEHREVALAFAPDNLTVADDVVWAAGPVSLWRYAAFRAGWLASPGVSAVARWRPGEPVSAFTVPATVVRGVTVALAVGDHLVLGAAYDDHLALCRRP